MHLYSKKIRKKVKIQTLNDRLNSFSFLITEFTLSLEKVRKRKNNIGQIID